MTDSIVRVTDKDILFDVTGADFDQTFPAPTTLILSTMCANVAVVGLPNIRDIRILAKGNRSDELNVEVSGPEVKVSAPLDFYGYSGYNSMPGFSFSTSGISVINNVLHVDGRPVDVSNPMIMLVMVPVGLNLKVGMVIGKKVVIKDVRGTLEAKLQATTSIEVDYLTQANVRISGNGNFLCGAFEGQSFEMKVSGMGNGRIEHGHATNFKASISGMGSITFMGDAVDADLSVSGMGSITLHTCTGKLKKQRSGMGSINVLNNLSRGNSSGFSDW